MPDDHDSEERSEPQPPSPAPVEKKLSESEGGFRKGVDVLPTHHVDPTDAPPLGGLPAAQSKPPDDSGTLGESGGDGSSSSDGE